MKISTINQTKRKFSQVPPKESKTKHPEIIKTKFKKSSAFALQISS